MHTLSLYDKSQTLALGKQLAQEFGQKPALILLSGPLGLGKTTLAQAFIHALANSPESVGSPSYSYLNSYDTSPPLLHFDLYRISSADELHDLGLLEGLYDQSKLRLVEWPERYPVLKNYASLHVSLRLSQEIRYADLTYFQPSA